VGRAGCEMWLLGIAAMAAASSCQLVGGIDDIALQAPGDAASYDASSAAETSADATPDRAAQDASDATHSDAADASDGYCGDLHADSHNCGYCGHDCEAGACSSGVCQPVTLVFGQNGPLSIAVDEASVYWTTFYNTGAVMKVPIGGGGVITLASN
jgi:hypothetical protein